MADAAAGGALCYYRLFDLGGFFMFNFHLYNGFLPYRLFVSLTVAFCIWGVMSMTGQAQEPVFHVHEGDTLTGSGCYGTPIFHEHTGSKSSGNGCYKTAIKHSHLGNAQTGGGCYGQSLFHSHTGSSMGGGCYQSALYHNHSGNAKDGGGCYNTPIYHAHQGDEIAGGACYATPIYHQHEGNFESGGGCYTVETSRLEICNYFRKDSMNYNSPHTYCSYCDAATLQTMRTNLEKGHSCGITDHEVGGESICTVCGRWAYGYGIMLGEGNFSHEYEVRGYAAGCGMTEETVIGYSFSCDRTEDMVEAYELSCGKGGGSVERYILSCGKSETSVEGYVLNCGLQDGQILEYKRDCGMSSSDIIGYSLSCGMDEQTVVGVKEVVTPETDDVRQPVKVPIKLIHEKESEETDDIEEVLGGMKYVETDAEVDVEIPGMEVVVVMPVGETVDESASMTGVAAEREFATETTVFSVLGMLLLLVVLRAYFNRTVALYYYDDTNSYHSLGRIRFKRTQQGYHVKIGEAKRRRATTDRYRIRTTKVMQREAKNTSLFVAISSKVIKMSIKEYVDVAL